VGKDFCVVAADTRMSLGYSIPTRNYSKIYQLTSKCVMAASGMQADVVALWKRLGVELSWYEHQHGRSMSTESIAQYLSNTLYYKRFFPYYSFCIVAGVTDHGVGCCWSYDAVGSHQLLPHATAGSAQTLVQPLLDNQITRPHQLPAKGLLEMDREQAKLLLREALTSAAERDIHTGDWVDIVTVSLAGIEKDRFLLKFD
jgi:20S proteasome subunit beta 6